MSLASDEKKPHPAVTVTPLALGDGPLPPRPDEAAIAGSSASSSASNEDEYEYPDGGAVAWRQVAAGHFINAMACGYGAAFGVYQLYYATALGLPAAQVSWVGSVQVFLSNAASAAAGRLSDAGHARAAVLAGSAVALLGSFATSLATEYWHVLLAQGLATGAGLGLMYMPTVAVVSSYFRRRRALALALSSAGTGTGSIVFPAVVQYLIPRVGFPWAVRCAAFVAVAFVVIANLLLKPRAVPPGKPGPLVDWAAFREPPYTIFVTGSFLLFWALYFGFFYINTYAIEIASFTPTSAVSLLLITNAVGMPTRPLVGHVADRYLGPLNTTVVMVLSLGVAFFAWAAVATPAAMYGFAVLFGVTNAAAQSAFAAALAGISGGGSGGGSQRTMGARFGMCCTVLAFATVAGPPTAGAIIDYCGGNFLWAQVWAGLVTVLAAATIALARYWVAGAKLWVKV
ncbi:MFS general substrate transporter [Hypoxylon sp. FL1284]|nr:MFS general substrate transporter [Hypoxylon sp. FL1284]